MKKIKNKIQQFLHKLNTNILLDRQKRKDFELCIISGVFFLAGAAFTIINFITKEYNMAYVTLSFSVISLATCLLTIFLKKWRPLMEFLFVCSSLIMFFYFLLSGGAGDNGFSTYWIMVLPFVSMMVLGLKKGSIAGAGMFLLIALFLWVPWLRQNCIKWNPDKTFILRFPLVYLAAFLASLLFEWSRYLTDKVNIDMTQTLKDAASHDPLTGLTNRYGLNKLLSEFDYNSETATFHTANCMLIDVDNFKSANDNYGHLFGDKVLIEISKILRNYAGEWAIRFGGDEFILLFTNKSDKEMFDLGEKIRTEIASLTYDEAPGSQYTVSVGIASHKIKMSYRVEGIIELADKQSSLAKKQGKNCVYLLNYEEMMKKNKKIV